MLPKNADAKCQQKNCVSIILLTAVARMNLYLQSVFGNAVKYESETDFMPGINLEEVLQILPIYFHSPCFTEIALN
jgi:hypothetical protein